ncbi:MAG: class I SAM-dependent methyltransferase [Candidatus Zixiibacteriota bacterium]
MNNQGYEKSAKLYDIFDNKKNHDFFMEYAQEQKEILDIGAGTGRIAIPLAKKKIDVYCVEPSRAMLDVFEKKISKIDIGGKIVLHKAFASTFKIHQKFKIAFMSGCFDHFLTDTERIDSLINIRKHLEDDGRLVFDVFIGLMEESELVPAGEIQIDNRVYKRFVGGKIVDNHIKETKLTYEIFEDGKKIDTIEEISPVGITSRERIHKLLKIANYEICNEYSDFDFTTFKYGDDLLIIEAMKK